VTCTCSIRSSLDEPITDAHGAEITERVSEVVYVAKTPLPEGYRDAFTLSLRVPDDAAGPLYFPTGQICEEGESGWIEIPAAGQDPAELALPSPVVEVVASTGTTGGHDDAAVETVDAAATDDDHDDETEAAAPVAATATGASADDDGSSNALAIAALVVGILALGTSACAIVRTRRS
jgi:hypothetical protein